MPALVRSVGMDVRRAAGTNLVVGFLLGVAGFATHAASLDVEWDLLAAGLAGAIPGAWIGARYTGVLSENTLRVSLAVMLRCDRRRVRGRGSARVNARVCLKAGHVRPCVRRTRVEALRRRTPEP